MEITMKKLIPVLLILVLLFPLSSHAQSIFADFVWRHAEDMSIFWVLTDPNNRKYKGNCDVSLSEDPNVYCQTHMDEWLQEIYEMNTDANIPDWQDTHLGKYTQTINQIENIDSWAENNAIIKKIVKYLQKQSAISE
jgi:hypothetical protein